MPTQNEASAEQLVREKEASEIHMGTVGNQGDEVTQQVSAIKLGIGTAASRRTSAGPSPEDVRSGIDNELEMARFLVENISVNVEGYEGEQSNRVAAVQQLFDATRVNRRFDHYRPGLILMDVHRARKKKLPLLHFAVEQCAPSTEPFILDQLEVDDARPVEPRVQVAEDLLHQTGRLLGLE